MLEYFYSGELDKSIFEKHVEDLFALAHKYEVTELIEKCDCFMAIKIGRLLMSYLIPYFKISCIAIMSRIEKNILPLYCISAWDSCI
uniref:BTB domain-containing protein n=1 Tax=Meloidogyne incognita TaxID=6306 RepID=A0A914MWX2_MELIC